MREVRAGRQGGSRDVVSSDTVKSVDRRILPNRKWLADEIALHRVAALLGEEAELLLRLDALGNDRHFQRVAEIDHGSDDCRRLRIAAEIDDEGAVDLDLVERERLQIAQ